MIKIKWFIRKIIKAQFFDKHLCVFIFFPIVFSFIIAYLNIYEKNVEKIIPNILTIIWITWSLLLNFLAIILTSNSTILSNVKAKNEERYAYWKINLWTKIIANYEFINPYYFVYYRTFFLIFLSIIFVISYILSFLWLNSLISIIDKHFSGILVVFNWFQQLLWYWIIRYLLIAIYLFLIILYFVLFFHLVYMLYYLFHEDDGKIIENKSK